MNEEMKWQPEDGGQRTTNGTLERNEREKTAEGEERETQREENGEMREEEEARP